MGLVREVGEIVRELFELVGLVLKWDMLGCLAPSPPSPTTKDTTSSPSWLNNKCEVEHSAIHHVTKPSPIFHSQIFLMHLPNRFGFGSINQKKQENQQRSSLLGNPFGQNDDDIGFNQPDQIQPRGSKQPFAGGQQNINKFVSEDFA
jgi:hypothetical protein